MTNVRMVVHGNAVMSLLVAGVGRTCGRSHTAALLLSLLVGCGDASDNEAVAVSQDPLLGAVIYASDCSNDLMPFLDQVMFYGRVAAASPAFQQCLNAAVNGSPLTVPVYGQNVAPYRQCTNDPFFDRPTAEQLAAVTTITHSENDVIMNCTGGGGLASTSIGLYGHADSEAFAWSTWLAAVHHQLSVPVCGTFGASPTDCRSAAYPWPYSQAAGVVWHETSHTQGYTHGANDQANAKVACGYTSDPTWNFQVNTMPYLIGWCMSAVIDQSGTTCGGDLATGCEAGALRMIDSFTGTTCSCVHDPRVNLAAGKTATQSSTLFGADASRALDGNTDGNWSNSSVTHTDNDAQAWWQVDLGAVTDIGEVVLYNRTDCCSDRLADFDVLLWNGGSSSWRTVASFFGPAPARTAFSVHAAGRFVKVRLRRANNLSLAEVQVFAPHNLAAGKTATQSSTLFGADASRAVDGNTDGNWSNNSVTHTDIDAQAWWQVDLGAVADIGEVILYNRTDCCSGRLADFDILVSSDGITWLTAASFGGLAPARTALTMLASGRFVKVRLRGTNNLSLAEVQVFAPHNLAAGKTATQSSTLFGADASRAVDGNTDGSWSNNSVTHTGMDAQAWWQVDLGAVTDIGEVVLYNRTDCCGDRLAEFDILVSSDERTWLTAASFGGPAPARTAFSMHATGRFVKVRLRGTNNLSLAEVRVFAP